jgi:hypothetical protein
MAEILRHRGFTSSGGGLCDAIIVNDPEPTLELTRHRDIMGRIDRLCLSAGFLPGLRPMLN